MSAQWLRIMLLFNQHPLPPGLIFLRKQTSNLYTDTIPSLAFCRYVDQIEKEGPNCFRDKEGLALLQYLNHTLADVYSQWDSIMTKLRGKEMVNILGEYLIKIKTTNVELEKI